MYMKPINHIPSLSSPSVHPSPTLFFEGIPILHWETELKQHFPLGLVAKLKELLDHKPQPGPPAWAHFPPCFLVPLPH
jgi:hypothetical protein